MKELHIHLHLDRELLADPQGSIHIHLKPEGHAAGAEPIRRKRKRPQGDLESSSYASTACRSGWQGSGYAAMASGAMEAPRLAREQRIRSRMYRLDAVPPAESSDSQQDFSLLAESETGSGLMLELASGNQVSPIVWESCDPAAQRGLWRLSVREDFGRLVGMLTHARDPQAIWLISDWTPQGTLVLEPAERQRYPRLMLTPVAAFQR